MRKICKINKNKNKIFILWGGWKILAFFLPAISHFQLLIYFPIHRACTLSHGLVAMLESAIHKVGKMLSSQRRGDLNDEMGEAAGPRLAAGRILHSVSACHQLGAVHEPPPFGRSSTSRRRVLPAMDRLRSPHLQSFLSYTPVGDY